MFIAIPSTITLKQAEFSTGFNLMHKPEEGQLDSGCLIGVQIHAE